MRDLLGRFGLVGEQVYQRVADLSGGERSRAALARLVALEVNVLVLDEPTNHLDLWACDSLEAALVGFDGTAIVVSHDRYFLNRVVDLLVVLDGKGQCEIIHGNYDTYERMRGGRETPAPSPANSRREGKAKTASSLESHTTAEVVPKRRRRFPYRKVEDIEAEITEVEGELRDLEQLLSAPELYRDGERVKETRHAFETTKTRLERLYEHWEEASELN
jgi:ATP-binding cassette subfamily F protein 3